MATRHPRIGVTADEELRAALAATRHLVDEPDRRSQAGQLRRLALIGAGSLLEGPESSHAARDCRRVVARPGVRPATRRLTDFPWLEGQEVDHTCESTRTLDWVRGDR